MPDFETLLGEKLIPICVYHIKSEEIPYYLLKTMPTYKTCYRSDCSNVTHFVKVNKD